MPRVIPLVFILASMGFGMSEKIRYAWFGTLSQWQLVLNQLDIDTIPAVRELPLARTTSHCCRCKLLHRTMYGCHCSLKLFRDLHPYPKCRKLYSNTMVGCEQTQCSSLRLLPIVRAYVVFPVHQDLSTPPGLGIVHTTESVSSRLTASVLEFYVRKGASRSSFIVCNITYVSVEEMFKVTYLQLFRHPQLSMPQCNVL
jgi:hypothetical protein